MFKMVALLKRRPGMSTDEFRNYYETYHRVIGEKYLKGYAERYMRRYLNPYQSPVDGGGAADQPFDVVLEIWYPDRATFDACNAHLATPEVAAEIAEDEERVFDRPQNRFFYVDEVESDLNR